MMLTGGLWAETATVARDPEENATTVTMMTAGVTGSVFISKANFMSGASGEGADDRKGSKERVCEGARVRGRNQGQKRRPKLGQRILHGSSVWAKT